MKMPGPCPKSTENFQVEECQATHGLVPAWGPVGLYVLYTHETSSAGMSLGCTSALKTRPNQ